MKSGHSAISWTWSKATGDVEGGTKSDECNTDEVVGNSCGNSVDFRKDESSYLDEERDQNNIRKCAESRAFLERYP
jgi:hypothetical protein